MAQSIDNHLIEHFSDRLHAESQQINARLRRFSTIKQMTGDLFAYDGLGTIEANEISGRIVPTVFNDIDHKRRQIARRRFVVTLPLDSSDVRGSLADHQSEYAMACRRAMERVYDRVGVEAAFADVKTGRDFGTTVTFAGDGGKTVNATAGLTYAKLLEINKNWRNEEVGTDMPEEKVLLMTGTEEEALMAETNLISGDFSRQFVVDQGEITKGVGINFVFYGADVPNPILDVNSGTRDNVAMTARGLVYGMSKEAEIKIDNRPDYVETTQIQIVFELGAVRSEGALVQKVQTTA